VLATTHRSTANPAKVAGTADSQTSFFTEETVQMLRLSKFLPLVAVAVVFGWASSADAAYKVTLTSGANTAVINDNNLPPGNFNDANGALNPITSENTTSPGSTISSTGSTNPPAAGGTALQTSQTLTVTASASAVSPLVIDVFADGYTLGLPAGTGQLSVNNSISTTL